MTANNNGVADSRKRAKHAPEATRELVNRLLRYDNLAWEELLRDTLRPLACSRKYLETLHRFLLGPEDLISEFYRIVHKDHFARLRNFRCECSIGTWAYDMMHAAYKNILFRYEKKKKKISVVPSETAPDRAPSKMKNGFQEMRSRETRQRLNADIAALWDRNPLEALVFLLRVHCELTSKETAFILGKTVNHVDVMKKRAVEKLKEIEGTSHA